MRLIICIALLLSMTSVLQANAKSKTVEYGKPADWVVATPRQTDSPTPDGIGLRIIHFDSQINLGSSGTEHFTAYRMKILKPEALVAGNIVFVWRPDAGSLKVHYVQIIRNGNVIDILKTKKFQVVQREEDLEQAILDGSLTAILQVPGLQIGDELAFAATIVEKDAVLGNHSSGAIQLSPESALGAFRIRVLWPEGRNIRWKTSSDIVALEPVDWKGNKVLTYELRDPQSLPLAVGAPNRVNIRRLVEFTDYASWKALSQKMWPLYDQAAALTAASEVRKEIERIAAASNDPVQRAEAALQLVQDHIRYVAVGINGGNLKPAGINDTWQRRFGDCKGKTVLLLAILRELGIEAEAVLVNSAGGDGLDKREPIVGLFDHVLVRAKVAGKTYWLDGTRFGDRFLSLIPAPHYRWVLPLRIEGADLEAVPATPPSKPLFINILDIDARAGFSAKAKVSVRQILRGDAAMQSRIRLASMLPDEVDRSLKAYWREQQAWIDVDKVAWRYLDDKAALELSASGEGELDWSGTNSEGRSLDIPDASFFTPEKYRRPKDQDQAAPWAVAFPVYSCWATAIQLPPVTSRWKWNYFAKPMHVNMGGVTYWRASDMRDNVMRTVISKYHSVPEISADQAEQVNKQLLTFNNKISRIYQIDSSMLLSSDGQKNTLPFEDTTDWLAPDTPCGASQTANP